METHALWKCIRGVVGTRRVGCGFWNVYVSRKNMPKQIFKPYAGVKHNSKTSPYSRSCKGSGFGSYRPRQVGTRCRHCNARVRFQLSETRGDGRGRSRRVSVCLNRPTKFAGVESGMPYSLDEWTLLELINECNRLNRGEQKERDGFVRASEYRRG